MFGSGFGRESELRDATRHRTGRRHEPRDMAAARDGTATATKATSGDVRAQRQAHEQAAMAAAAAEAQPHVLSFVERMCGDDAQRHGHARNAGGNNVTPTTRVNHDANTAQTTSVTAAAAATDTSRARPSLPRDQLNLFAWDSGDNNKNTKASAARARHNGSTDNTQQHTQQQQQRQSAMPCNNTATRTTATTAARATTVAEAQRSRESDKFAQHTDGNFLRFSEDNNNNSNSNGVGAGARTQARGGSNNNNASSNMRAVFGGAGGGDAAAATSGEAAARLSKRRAPAQQQQQRGGEAAPGIDGFPGMGQSSAYKQPQGRLPRQAPGTSATASSVAEAMMYSNATPSAAAAAARAPRPRDAEATTSQMYGALPLPPAPRGVGNGSEVDDSRVAAQTSNNGNGNDDGARVRFYDEDAVRQLLAQNDRHDKNDGGYVRDVHVPPAQLPYTNADDAADYGYANDNKYGAPHPYHDDKDDDRNNAYDNYDAGDDDDGSNKYGDADAMADMAHARPDAYGRGSTADTSAAWLDEYAHDADNGVDARGAALAPPQQEHAMSNYTDMAGKHGATRGDAPRRAMLYQTRHNSHSH